MSYKLLSGLFVVIISLALMISLVALLGLMRGDDNGNDVALFVFLSVAAVTTAALRLIRTRKRRAHLDGVKPQKPETSHTIYIALYDEHGAPLSQTEQAQRLAQARQQAGPRDTIVSLTRPPTSD